MSLTREVRSLYTDVQCPEEGVRDEGLGPGRRPCTVRSNVQWVDTVVAEGVPVQ